MATVNIEVLAQVDDAVRGLANTSTSFNNFQHANQDAAGALGVFGVSLTSLNNPMTLVAGTIKDSMDTANKWGETIQHLSAASGQNAQQTSTMAVVLGDLGVNVDGLDKTVKTFTKNGLEFNLETLQKLALQYQAIEDPVKRNEFAFKNFGKSALDMNEVLSASPEKLAKLAQSAQFTGKVIDDSMVKSLEDARVKTKQFDDQLEGAKVRLGAFAIDTVAKAGDGLRSYWGILNSVAIATEAYTGAITWQQATAREANAANGDTFAAFHAAIPVLAAVTDASDRLAKANIDEATSRAIATAKVQEARQAQEDLASGYAHAQAASSTAAGAMSAFNVATANASIANDTLFQSLAKVTNASLATAAIKDLQAAMTAHPENTAAYQAAIETIGVKAGLMTPAGIAAGTAITTLGELLKQQRISPEDYAAALDKIPAATKGGVIPAMKDLGVTLDPAKLHFEDASRNAKSYGTALNEMPPILRDAAAAHSEMANHANDGFVMINNVKRATMDYIPVVNTMPAILQDAAKAHSAQANAANDGFVGINNVHRVTVNYIPVVDKMPAVLAPAAAAFAEMARQADAAALAIAAIPKNTTITVNYVTNGDSAAALRAVNQNQSQYQGGP